VTQTPASTGIAVRLAGSWLAHPTPIGLRLADGPDGGTVVRAGYDTLGTGADGAVYARADLTLPDGGALRVEDTWHRTGESVTVARRLTVTADGPTPFAAGLGLRVDGAGADWTPVEPFAPGVTYGDVAQVGRWALGGLPARQAGVRTVLVREDRLAAPVVALRLTDGRWVAVLHTDPDGGTVVADGLDTEGDTLTDERLRYASLGAEPDDTGLTLGLWFPGTEGECTYTSGGLPLEQRRRWRPRFHPVRVGLTHTWTARLRAGTSADRAAFVRTVWRWAWDELRPTVRPVPVRTYLADTARVLASQVRQSPGPDGVTGIGLESDPVHGRPIVASSAAVMGFVGANTDAAAVLLRLADELPDADELRTAARAVLDSFARLPLDPPAGEGFDLATGRPTTYRTLDGRPAVFLRALAEGCHAALRACASEPDPLRAGHWRRWALGGADWLLGQQRPDGSWPRAWEAGTGRVLQPSPSATALAVPFLVAAARARAGDGAGRPSAELDAAVAAGTFAWERYGRELAFAGATLDNPDVVDKEASVLALEAFLALHRATGDPSWLERAVVAADVAETWVHLWDVPMPVDADPAAQHWKPGRPTTGLQVITSGVSMSDGFLAVNAAAFADLARRTGDPHYLDVARVVHHGSKAMLATRDDRLDLADPGWQQEHWGLATRRGQGLNRHWLPWAAVATLDGVLRLRDLGDDVAARVL